MTFDLQASLDAKTRGQDRAMPLLDGIPESASTAPPPKAVGLASRRKYINRAFEHADKRFKDQYRRHLSAFGSAVEDFIAGEVTESYEARYGKVAERQLKGLGGLFLALQREGIIVKTGAYRARNQGNASAVYRLK